MQLVEFCCGVLCCGAVVRREGAPLLNIEWMMMVRLEPLFPIFLAPEADTTISGKPDRVRMSLSLNLMDVFFAYAGFDVLSASVALKCGEADGNQG